MRHIWRPEHSSMSGKRLESGPKQSLAGWLGAFPGLYVVVDNKAWCPLVTRPGIPTQTQLPDRHGSYFFNLTGSLLCSSRRFFSESKGE
jgi:hypothetical protein